MQTKQGRLRHNQNVPNQTGPINSQEWAQLWDLVWEPGLAPAAEHPHEHHHKGVSCDLNLVSVHVMNHKHMQLVNSSAPGESIKQGVHLELAARKNAVSFCGPDSVVIRMVLL